MSRLQVLPLRTPSIRRLVRYGAVSVVATSVSLAVLGVLVATGAVAPAWANVIATAVGTVPSFELNRRWVWGRTGRRSVLAEIGPFCALSFAGLALSTLAVGAAAAWATGAGVGGPTRTLAVEGANLAAFGSLWVVQFVILNRLMFGRSGRAAHRGGGGNSVGRAEPHSLRAA